MNVSYWSHYCMIWIHEIEWLQPANGLIAAEENGMLPHEERERLHFLLADNNNNIDYHNYFAIKLKFKSWQY